MSWKFWKNERAEYTESMVRDLSQRVAKLEGACYVECPENKRTLFGSPIIWTDNPPVGEVLALLLRYLGLRIVDIQSTHIIEPLPKQSPKRPAKKRSH